MRAPVVSSPRDPTLRTCSRLPQTRSSLFRGTRPPSYRWPCPASLAAKCDPGTKSLPMAQSGHRCFPLSGHIGVAVAAFPSLGTQVWQWQLHTSRRGRTLGQWVFSMWSLHQQHKHHPETCGKCKFAGPAPKPLDQKQGRSNLCFNKFSGWFCCLGTMEPPEGRNLGACVTPWEQNWQELFKPLYFGAPLTVNLRHHLHPLQHPSSYIRPGSLTPDQSWWGHPGPWSTLGQTAPQPRPCPGNKGLWRVSKVGLLCSWTWDQRHVAAQLTMTAAAICYWEPVCREREETAANQKPKQEGATAQLPEASGSSPDLAQFSVLLSLGGFSPFPSLEIPYMFSLCSVIISYGIFFVFIIFEVFHYVFSYAYLVLGCIFLITFRKFWSGSYWLPLWLYALKCLVL